MGTILGLIFLYLALNFIIIAFFINASIPEEYYMKDGYFEEEDKWE